MGEEGSWNRVLAELGTALMRDRSAARVLGRTAGGLVEVTRRRSREPLAQLLTGSWRGRSVRSVETAVYEALRAVRREAGRRPGRLQVAVAPEVAAALEGPHLTALSEAIGREVIVVPEPAWPRGRIEIAAR
jgi:ribonuclease G